MKIKDTGSNGARSKARFRCLKRDWQLYFLLSLPLIAVLLFKYIPMAGLSIAFLDYDVIKGFSRSEFIGLDIFKEIFGMSDFKRSLRNTLGLNILDLAVGFPIPIVLALFLNEIKWSPFKRVSQTLLYLPHFLSWVIIAGIMSQLLSTNYGLVNTVLESMGVDRVPFLTEKYHWVASYVLIGVWQNAGWGTIIFLSAIAGINSELYEAAVVDGAKRWHKVIYITLPAIKGTIVIMLIMNLGRLMGGSFERAYLIGNTIVKEFSQILPVFVYEVGLRSYRYNVATAVGLFQSLIGFLLILAADALAKKLGEEGLI